jgi:hypothetical protein
MLWGEGTKTKCDRAIALYFGLRQQAIYKPLSRRNQINFRTAAVDD